jgi:hypothetical protein
VRQLTTADMSEGQAPAASVLRTVSLKVFLGFSSASAWRRQLGKSEDLKGADSAGSVRVDYVLFMWEMVEFHSFFGIEEGVSPRGQWSSSTFSVSCAGEGSPR